MERLEGTQSSSLHSVRRASCRRFVEGMGSVPGRRPRVRRSPIQSKKACKQIWERRQTTLRSSSNSEAQLDAETLDVTMAAVYHLVQLNSTIDRVLDRRLGLHGGSKGPEMKQTTTTLKPLISSQITPP